MNYTQRLTGARPNPLLAYGFVALTMLLTISPASAAGTPSTPCQLQVATPQRVLSSGWSNDLKQSRFVGHTDAGITGNELTQLQLQWSFVFKDAVSPRSVPAVTEQMILVAGQDGSVFALDRTTGCSYWHFKAGAEVRTGISIASVMGQQLVFFGDLEGYTYAVSASSGQRVWKKRMDEHPIARITGSPVFYNDRLYVPLSSFEVAHALNPLYNCCTFRGGVHAVDAATGRTIWKTHTIPEEAKLTGRNRLGARQYGPSGAPVWSAPTIDKQRGLLYVASGQNYSSPADKGSDAIFAMDLDSGEVIWQRQMHENDAWNASCAVGRFGANCPDEEGPDFDFGASPMLITNSEGKDFIIAGQKSGMVYALDPDKKGTLLWSRRVGRGGMLGGVHWGLAANDDAVYVPITDVDMTDRKYPGEPNPSISKLDLSSGDIIWQTKVDFDCEGIDGCRNGLSSAVTLIEGAVIAPGLDGVIHAYDSDNGKELWAYDTKREYTGVNGLTGNGGTLDAGGVVVADGLLLSNSGYGGKMSAGGVVGNMFLVFALPQ